MAQETAQFADEYEDPVIVVWVDGPNFMDSQSFCVLGGMLGTRIYEKDQIDFRAGHPTYMPTMKDALEYFKENHGCLKSVQLPLKEARKFGLL